MATALSIFADRFRKAVAAVGFGVRSSATQADGAVPLLTSGSGVPSAANPDGSLYLRTAGGSATTLYARVASGWEAIQSAAVWQDQFVTATITVPNVTGGGTDAALTLQLKRASDHDTNIASARQVLIIASAGTAYPAAAGEGLAGVAFSAATVGSIVGSAGNGSVLAQTNASGAFACTAANVADETAQFKVITAEGVSDLATRCVVVGSNVDAATWSA